MFDLERLLRRAAPSGVPPTGAFLTRDMGNPDGSTADRLARWRNNAAGNSTEDFAKRLAWEGLTPETVRTVLGDERAIDPADDSWVGMARAIVRRLTEPGSAFRPIPSGIPFASILSPLANLAIDELVRAESVPPLIQNIEAQLSEPLYKRLSGISHRAIGAEFRRFRDALPSREGAWRAFEEHMRREGLFGLFERLPVLLRLAATAISLWVKETAEFLRRLEADREDLGSFLGHCDACSKASDLGAVEEIASGLSDPHNSGRNVKIVRFASGLRAVYKPRNIAVDLAWLTLTEWMAQRTGVALRAPRVLNRGDWGWAEFIAHEPCKDTDAVARFYRRAGHLLCLLYATESTDFHDENMVASGEFPVPIDMETVFNPEPFELEENNARLTRQIRGSVLDTLMLPGRSELRGRNDDADLSALGSRPEAEPEIDIRRWVNPNSDAMEYVAVRERRERRQNAPFLPDGSHPDAGHFAGEVAAGFAEAYDCLSANRAELLSSHGPLEAFRHCRTRFLIRPTRIYDALAGRALNEGCLAFGVDRSLEFEGVSRHYLASRESHGSRALFRAEVRALEQLDVPYFQLRTDSRELLDGEGKIVEGNFIRTPGYEMVRRRIAALSRSDRAFQLSLIRASFIGRDFGGLDQPPLFGTLPGAPNSPLLETARGIARDIESRAIWSGHEASWIGLESMPDSGRSVVRQLGISLYSGSAGLAVFLAAQFAVDGGPEYRKAALGITRALRRSFIDSTLDRKTLRTVFLAEGIGGARGAGSTIYGLLKAGQILNDEETLDTAWRLSKYLDGDSIRADENSDVIGGTAGAIFSLLALWRHTGETELLQKAGLCGERLLELRTADGAWLTIARRPLAGFSHGAAGIGLALLRLHAAAPGVRFRDAAMAGFAYERTLFSPAARNWQDLREGVRDRFTTASWCHGAPGVALSRVGALKLFAGEEWASPFRSDLESGLRYLASGNMGNNGTVCCGEMGRAEILLEAARQLNRPELEISARQRASCVAAGLLQAGERPFVPGFFQGSSGIGYGLLRLIAPDRLPCILLWE